MTDHRSRRWFQLSLKSLFLLTLVVAAFFGGYSLAQRRTEDAMRAEQKARALAEEAARQAETEAKRLDAERLGAVIDLAVQKAWNTVETTDKADFVEPRF
jgi:hypothetical protein